MKRDLRIEKVYPHPPARVWSAITSRDALAQWLMENDFKLEIGHRFQFRTDPAPGFDGIVNCEVLSFEEPRHLSFTWKGGPVDTVVKWTLEPVAVGTRFIFEQTGFEGFQAVFTSEILRVGSKKIYGKLLPGVLDRMRPDGSLIPADEPDPECEKTGWWQVLARIGGVLFHREHRRT